MTREIAPVSPGEMLLEEYLLPLGLSQYALAKAIGVPPRRINEIVHGTRAVTADTDLRLCRYFGLSDGWWLRLQAKYDTERTRESMAEVLAAIKPIKILEQV
ncbi:MAG: addiction module antidote protein, HigA family [Hydrogenophilales bacterium 28-61-23]|nr:MAG: addiction module antidote protein, HigA family [Hydrogenophilales bacterium 28-61-23]